MNTSLADTIRNLIELDKYTELAKLILCKELHIGPSKKSYTHFAIEDSAGNELIDVDELDISACKLLETLVNVMDEYFYQVSSKEKYEKKYEIPKKESKNKYMKFN